MPKCGHGLGTSHLFLNAMGKFFQSTDAIGFVLHKVCLFMASKVK